MAHVMTENVVSNAAKPDELLTKWCSENNLVPNFKFSVNKQNQKYRCGLEIPGYNYVGVGDSKLKKSAQKKAIKDFLLFLVSKNAIPPIPKKIKNTKASGISPLTNGINSMSINSTVHGNWTEDSALKRLKQFIKSNKKNIFNKTCELTEKSCSVEMSIFIEKLNKTLISCEVETSKTLATKKCALSLVSQLCINGQIERNLSAQKKKEKVNVAHDVYQYVDVNEKLVNEVYSVLDDLDIIPMVDKNSSIIQENTMLVPHQVTEPSIQLNQFSSARVISWCPPTPNWNTWSSFKISSPKSFMDINYNMEKKISIKTKQSFAFQNRAKDRTKLPIFEKKNAILNIIKDNSVVIVQGGTGCGKTTQVCQFILDEHIYAKKGAHCNIICTQPRKVSAISIANRVAFERAENLGESIGYTVRFDSINPRPFGAILFCTVEILIRKLRKGLIGISHIIVDEIHERHADSEFLLIILKEMVQKYPDLRVILMSANANLDIFSKYFNNCPIIDVKGRCYPVKEYFLEDIVQLLDYKPILEKKNKKKIDKKQVNCNLLVSEDYSDHIRNRVAMIDEDCHHLKLIESLLIFIENSLKIDGAVLIFLPGWAWITELNNYLLQKDIAQKCSILLLHSSLSHAEQHKVFKSPPRGQRKVILSTNIAETSITIEDVAFVIDYGKVKLVEFSNNITKFETVWASKVNVEQRKGRAGRVQQGICFNLYTKARFNLLDDNIIPELTHCPLSKIGLTIKLLHLGDIQTFLKKAIDPPSVEDVNSVITMLKEMKCIGANGNLTALGNILAQLPVEPKFGRMMILGNILMLGEFLSIIAAGSSTNYDLFLDYDGENTTKHNHSGNRCSDQIAFLNAFLEWNSSIDYYYNSANMNISEEYNLSASVLKTTQNIKNQIINMFIQLGFPKCCFGMKNTDGVKNADESHLDILPALLTMAFYPNIYCYKSNRKVNLKTKEFAVICRSSVNSHTIGLTDEFHSPFFVFEEQVNVMCVHSTMVSPIHLLLFGASKVEYVNNAVVLDDWIFLKMDVKVAAAITALRPAIEDLIVRTTENPKLLLRPNKVDTKLINVLRDLCNFNAGRNHSSPIIFKKDEKKSVKTEKQEKIK